MKFSVKWSSAGEPIPEAMRVRKAVFMDEQKFTYDEDSIDFVAYHLALCDDLGHVLGAARVYKENGTVYHAGRICVLSDYRGMELGNLILKEIEKKALELGGDAVVVGAQMRASGFYKKNGYEAYGSPYFEEYCEHINMRKKLKQ